MEKGLIMSHGKTAGFIILGLFCFVVIFSCFCIAWKFLAFPDHILEIAAITSLIGSVTIVVGIIFGSVATKNFKRQDQQPIQSEDEGDNGK